MNIREARLKDAEAIARVHVDSWQTTYRNLLPDDYIGRQSYLKRQQIWQKLLQNSSEQKDYFIYVAENLVGEIVGFIDGGTVRGNFTYDGEIYALYILEAYQRKSIGRNLVRVLASRLSQLGLTSVMVWVLEGNPAVEFYQALGGQRIGQKPIKTGDDKFREIAYGWKNTQTFVMD